MEEFSYSVSHDLRAPVRAIEGYARILDKDCRALLPAKAQGHLDKILRSTARMNRLINDVLTLSRVAQNEIRLHEIALRPFIEELIEQYPEMHRANIELGELHTVIGDDASLSQAVSNVLSNGVKFVTPGVRPHVRVWSESREESVRIWVTDNGIGIAPELQGKLFGMFQRLRPNEGYEGTGIGLAIVRKAVERMNGAVGVESDGKNGSRFWIDLPSPSSARVSIVRA
jgi:signal transduction histidine kinase